MPLKKDVEVAVTQMVDAVNRTDMAAASTWFADGAVIVEDIPPYRWDGPDAVSNWLKVVAGSAKRRGVGAVSMKLGGATRIDVEGDRAYALFPGLLTFRTAGGNFLAEGLLTFTLIVGDDRWLIDTLAWSGPNPKLAECPS